MIPEKSIAALILLLMTGTAHPMDRPTVDQHRQHNVNDPNHWYDRYCCDEKDCRKAEEGEVVEVSNHEAYPGGPKMSGYLVLGRFFVPYGDKRIRPSRDAHIHFCIAQGEVYDAELRRSDDWLRCLYVPMVT